MGNKILILGALIASGVAVYLPLHFMSPDIGSTSSQRSQSNGPANSQHLQAKEKATSNFTNAQSVGNLNYLEAYNKAKNYRAFLYDFLRSPQTEGIGYAYEVLSECDYAARVHLPPGAPDDDVSLAAAQLTARCEMSGSERDDVIRQISELRDQKLLGDPNSDLALALSLAKTPMERSIAVAAIIQSGNPFIMRTLLTPQASLASANGQESGVYFQNRWYQMPQEAEKIDAAYDLATCQLGLDCSRGSTKAMMLCVEKWLCGGSVQDVIRRKMNGQGTNNFDEVASIASQFVQQIKAGNAAAFVYTGAP